MNPTTKYTFEDLFKDVLDLSGKSRDSSGDDLTEAKRIVNHAYRKFLIAHDWSFLKMQGVLVTTSGDYDYDLPDDFAELIDAIWDTGEIGGAINQEAINNAFEFNGDAIYNINDISL